jgi:hypothetical protein
MIRDNGDVLEALACLGAWFVLLVAGVWAMDKIQIWWKTKRGA